MSSDKYNFFSIEEKIREFWKNRSIYSVIPNRNKKTIVIDTPPPTISGKLHVGHVFSYTQQDIIARALRLEGNQVIYPFGLDDNGLPTERYLEQKKNISSHSMSRTEFITQSLEQIKEAQSIYIKLWQNLGFSVDWELVYSTISTEVQKVSQKSFIELYKKGYIYKKYEPALFCTAYRTSVSQADLEEKEKESFMNTILFFESETNTPIQIGTTRPELLAGCVALFIHPDDTRFNQLIGKIATVPLYDFSVPILGDKRVIPEKGTGIVMCCTFGDSLDIAWFKEYALPYKKIIHENGTLTDITLFLQGMKVPEARESIIQKLKEADLLINQEKIIHRVSLYERSKKEIEYLMLSQWFVSLLPFKKEFIELGNKINWFPEYMKYRYIDWVENLSWDWCISRQRTFGIPFPVWYDKEGKIILASESSLPVDPLVDLPEGIDKDSIIPDRDIMDTWNTSSLTPYIIKDMLEKKGIEIDLPLSIRPQAHDIIRTWAFDTIVKSFFHENKIPWKDIVISGHVLSSDAQKISKSKENSPLDPENLIKLYPADVIRYWTASAKLGVDTAFSESPFRDGNRLLIKLYNAALCLKNFSLFDRTEIEKEMTLQEPVNLWIMSALAETIDTYTKDFSLYECSSALKAAEKLFWSFCDHYLEIMKMYIFYENTFEALAIKETKLVSAKIFLEILKLLSPFLPHLTEYLFQEYFVAGTEKYKEQSLHKLTFDSYSNKNYLEIIKSGKAFDIIIKIIEEVRRLKTGAKLSLKTEIDKAIISTSLKKIKKIIDENDLILTLVNSIKVITVEEKETSEESTLLKNENEAYILTLRLESNCSSFHE